MAKKSRSNLAAFEEYLLNLVKTSEPRPFTADEVWQIMHRHGMPSDLSPYHDEERIAIMKRIHAEQLARAEANFREPSRMHAFGELLESTLVLKDLFISQLAEQSGISVEEIEAYVEKRLPAQPLRDDQLARLAEVSGIALAEIRRIAMETTMMKEVEAV